MSRCRQDISVRRFAVGPKAGQKLTLQTLPARLHGLEGDHNEAARAGGFSLHAGNAKTRGNELGAPAQAGVRSGDRWLRPLQREAQDHCKHRRDCGHCKDSGASGEDGRGGFTTGTCATGRTGTR